MSDAAPIVRAAELRDADALSSLVGELGYPSTADRLLPRLSRLLANERVRVLVAAQREALVGLCTAHLLTTIHADGDVAQLTALVVAERARGSGVGRMLVEETEGWARRQGAGRIVVTTALHRAGAHAFYEKLGYSHTGRRYARVLA